jgi:hypothetical protein
MNKYAGFDTSQAHFDAWSILQVGWLLLIAVRAIMRLSSERLIHIPKQVRSILKYPFFLGLLYLVSVTYSPGRIVSAEYCVLYFLFFICFFEFLVDIYRNPPDWIQCLFYLRFISLLLLGLIILVLPIEPTLVMNIVPGAGIRILGGTVAAMALICPIIAIISAYSFLHTLEPRTRAALFLLVGLAGTLPTQVRGAEISLFLVLVLLIAVSPKTGRRSTYLFIAGSTAFILVLGLIVGTVGGVRVWSKFNRGQDNEGIVTLSGRTGVWKSLIQYSMTHPQGTGYIAGIRRFHGGASAESMHGTLNNIGGTDNAYMETLADAGWLALLFYLIMLAKVAALGWLLVKRHTSIKPWSDRSAVDAIRCSLLLLIYCLGVGVEDTGFVNPLRQEFYIQNIIIAIILGASTCMLIALRSRYITSS